METNSATAFILVKTGRNADIDKALGDLEGVSEAHVVAGSTYNLLLKIIAENNSELGRLVRNLQALDGIEATDVMIALGAAVTLSNPDFLKSAVALPEAPTRKPYQRFLDQLLVRGKDRFKFNGSMRVNSKPYSGAAIQFSGLGYFYYIARHWSRAEIYFSRINAAENKDIFDCLLASKTEIENTFSRGELRWERLNHRRACRISFTIPGGYTDSDSSWPEVQDHLIDVMIKIEAALAPHLDRLRPQYNR